jgi:hypothetical protein
MYLEPAAVHAAYKVLVEFDDKSALIVGDLQVILFHLLWPHPIQLRTLFSSSLIE